eukprot:4105465-Prymnesium_polylepis.1
MDGTRGHPNRAVRWARVGCVKVCPSRQGAVPKEGRYVTTGATVADDHGDMRPRPCVHLWIPSDHLKPLSKMPEGSDHC